MLLPVALAMVLHGIAQAFSNGFRTWFFRDDIYWPVLPLYIAGAAVAFGICWWLAYVPEKSTVFLMLGLIATASVVLPKTKLLDITTTKAGVACGFVVTMTQILSGVSGPMLDIFYLKTKLNRYQIMATKSMTQTLGHLIKLVYYGQILLLSAQEQTTLSLWVLPLIVIATFSGARLGRYLLQYVSDLQFMQVTRGLIFVIGLVYLYKGVDELHLIDKAVAMLNPNTTEVKLASGLQESH